MKDEALRLADAQDCVTDDNCGYCVPCSVAAELRRLSAENDALLEALKNTVPALIRLGDFVGNTDDGGASGMGRIDRCALLLQVRNAITAVERLT